MRLDVYMAREGLDDEEMAKRVRTPKVNCDRTMISKYRRRISRPDWPVIEQIQKVTGGDVTANDFVELETAR